MTNSADGNAPGGSPAESSYVFLVRLWAEEDTNGIPAWCGKVQHVTSGEAHTFRDWPALVAQLRAMLPGPEAVAPEPEHPRAIRSAESTHPPRT
jgi:hypothetical protein